MVPLYAAGLAVKDGLRAAGVLRTRRLAWPVVSVGSLSAGGAGKTPVVIALAELLRGRGWGVDVLSRGYGRSGRGVELVDVDASDAAGRFGDEPVLIARRTDVDVWVGADRFAAGMAAEGEAEQQQGQEREADSSAALRNDSSKKVHLLDDGFQHRALARTLDVVLVTEEDFDDAILPAGNRREGLRALMRADVVVLRADERGRIEARVGGWMRDDAAVWSVRRELRIAMGGAEGKGESQSTQSARESTEEWLGGMRLVAFCAIARPGGFFSMLAAPGCEIVGKMAFGDHHRYTRGDVEQLVKVADECGAGGFVTTEKDAVKLTAEMRARLEAVGPVCVARLDATFVDEAAVVRELEGRIG